MTKFADQLFDDLMREHGPALARTRPPGHAQRLTKRRMLLAGGGTLAVAGAIAGTLVASSGTPAYAVTKNPDGTITLAVYQQSGIAQANARLRQLGDGQVVVVPVEAGCPKVPPPAVSVHGVRISMQFSVSSDGSVTVNAQGIPAGDILVVGMQANGHIRNAVAIVTSPPAPSCTTPPAPPPGNGGSEPRLSASRNRHDVILCRSLPVQLHIVPAAACLNRARPGTAGPHVTPGASQDAPGAVTAAEPDSCHVPWDRRYPAAR